MITASLEAGIDSPQFQFNTAISQRFDYGFEAVFATETRVASSGRALREFEVMPELIWHYSPHWDFSVGYDQMTNWDKEGMKMQADLGFASTTFKLQLGKEFNFQNRAALEIGGDNFDENVVLFRNLTRISYTGWVLPYRLKPYISNEVYWQFQPTSDLTEDRLQLGVNYLVNRATTINFFTMLDDYRVFPQDKKIIPLVGLGVTIVF